MKLHKMLVSVAFLLATGCSVSDKDIKSVWMVARKPENGEATLYAVDGKKTGTLWAAGENGKMLFFNGRTWEPYETGLTDATIYSIDISSSANGWGVGASGTILGYSNDDWYKGPEVCGEDLRSVALNADGTGWAVGDKGRVLEFDGSKWSIYEHGLTTADLTAVATDGYGKAWAVGDGGIILRYDGTKWQTVNSPADKTLYDVSVTPIGVMACGDAGTLLLEDTYGWATIDTGYDVKFRSIAAFSPSKIIVIGEGNTIVEMNEDGWEAVMFEFYLIPDPVTLHEAVPLNSAEGWSVGSRGVILKYGPATDWYGDLFKNKWHEGGDKTKEEYDE